MTDTDLRDRIADVIRLRAITDTQWSIADLADAIVADLGLRHEWSYTRQPRVSASSYRYVTDWTTSD